MKAFQFIVFLLFLLFGVTVFSQSQKFEWPSVNRETKPWTRWWWHGSAVTKEGITAEMEAYKKAGLGGLEITPIYGVHGTEKQFINYLSPAWMDLFLHTLKEAERLDMGIDMATGTGWPFGGPWVTAADACKNLEYKTYTLKAGQVLNEQIVFIQQPYLRAVGGQIYEVHDSTIAGEKAKGTLKEPLSSKIEPLNIKDLVEPISANKNLQALALDQVKFEKSLPLQVLMAYGSNGKPIDLTNKVDKDGILNWTAPGGDWKLYAVFSGWHGKMVERAGPGGEGNVIDHFSATALKNYLRPFDKAFAGNDIKPLRAFFNDSYEVDDARGTADWTPLLFEEFKKRRGYDLREHLPALFAQDKEQKNSRVLCDYRETISELVLENFTRQWKAWAQTHNALVRNQAHGSPANILDLYATVDIPEIEGIEPLRIKMASSAGHVTGKKLISSESATWLNEHFESNLADIKVAVDRFLLNGVNHVFYHGTTYSPPGEPWPGRLFYAAVHLNPRNSLWPHFSALNKYVERAQSLLQNSRPENDVLLYYPIYDRFSTPGPEMIEHFDGVGAQFDNTAFKRTAEMMLARGYAYDYISDKQIINTKTDGTSLITEGNSIYKTLVVPHCKFIPLSTLKKIFVLAEGGATVIMAGGLPSDVNGYHNLPEAGKLFQGLIRQITPTDSTKELTDIKLGRGRIVTGHDAEMLLTYVRLRRENMVDRGLQFLRKKTRDNKTLYFISNGDDPFDGWVTLNVQGEGGVLYNPMVGTIGVCKVRKTADGFPEFRIRLNPRETVFIEVHSEKLEGPIYPVYKTGSPSMLEGTWDVSFSNGGPQIPSSAKVKSLASWTTFNNSSVWYSGSATYTLTFDRPAKKSDGWLLDLGIVKETANVMLNGKQMGTVIGPSYQVYVGASDLQEKNTLVIDVCNLMANRIAYMDKQGVFWKKFYNVNFPARKAENRKNGLFDASHWSARDSGLLGPVQLLPVTIE